MFLRLSLLVAVAALFGCDHETNTVDAADRYALCPLDADVVLAHASVDTAPATAAEAAAFAAALAAWQQAHTGGLRDVQSGAADDSVAITAAGGEPGALSVQRVAFDDAAFDRTALVEADAGWADVASLPCDFVVMEAPVTLALQFDDGAPLDIAGTWRVQQGALEAPLAFTGQAAQATLAALHPTLAGLTSPADVDVWISGATQSSLYGSFTSASATLAEFGVLEAMAD